MGIEREGVKMRSSEGRMKGGEEGRGAGSGREWGGGGGGGEGEEREMEGFEEGMKVKEKRQ